MAPAATAIAVSVLALSLAPCHGRAAKHAPRAGAAKHAARTAAAAKRVPRARPTPAPAPQASPTAGQAGPAGRTPPMATAHAAPTAAPDAMALSLEPGTKFTPDEEARWHYEEGMRLKKLQRMDEAVAQWKEAMRLKPDYPDVQKEFDEISAASEEHIKHEVADIKDALARYSKANTFFDLADILTNRSADEISWYLLNTEREEAMKLMNKPPASYNDALFDMFEDFMKRHGLFPMLPDHSGFDAEGTLFVKPKPNLTGRRLLSALGKWAKRICHSNVEIVMQRPDRINYVGQKLDDLKFIFRTPDWVEIDDPNSVMESPLEARREDGKWRIGAALGSRLHYQVSVRGDRYEKAPAGSH